MTRADDVRAVIVAAYGGADPATLRKRTGRMTTTARNAALRAALVNGSVVRNGTTYKPRPDIEKFCANCGGALGIHDGKATFRGEVRYCSVCERVAGAKVTGTAEQLIASGQAVLVHDGETAYAKISGVRLIAGHIAAEGDRSLTAVLASGALIPVGGGDRG